MQRLVQDLLPQVQELQADTLIEHIARVSAETGKRVTIQANAVFHKVLLPGFNLLPITNNNVYEQKALVQLDKRWTADLTNHCTSSPAVAAAFAATRKGQAPAPPRRGAKRTTRTSKSMAEPRAPPEVSRTNHMSAVCAAGRKAHVLRTALTAPVQKKLRVNVHTRDGAAMLEEYSHATYGEKWPAFQDDATGTEREMDVLIGKDCFEHATPPEWRKLGHPPVMRCHCIGVNAWIEDGDPPHGAFDYSIFHDDFSVETFDWDELVKMNLVRVPEIYITDEYTVWWTNQSGENRALTKEEYRGGFGDSRPKPLRTTPFWERM
jgi:hypothetical protein